MSNEGAVETRADEGAAGSGGDSTMYFVDPLRTVPESARANAQPGSFLHAVRQQRACVNASEFFFFNTPA